MNEEIKNHKFLTYAKNKSGRKVVRELTKDILNIYLKKNLSITKLKKIKPFKIEFTDAEKSCLSDTISYNIIEDYISRNNMFSHKTFRLKEIKCDWLDGNIDISTPQHFVDPSGAPVKICLPLPYGESFPVKPTLDREGMIFNSFQAKLLERITVLHNRLVDNSNMFSEPDWLFDFLNMIGCSISSVDILLNQLYIKAEYDKYDNWIFSKEALKERYNRRMSDKLEWVKLITGNPLDNIHAELKSFHTLKEIRNHTQHFDPPCFGFTLEEAAPWMNAVRDVGSLVYKIRQKIDSFPNESLLKIMLLPDIQFNGRILFNRDRAPHIDTGYQTTCWPSE